MPRIAAQNIEEHIRLQTTRILDAARDLFSANGYRGTDMSDIARSMGLARNSLYRYYPSKDHILVAVIQRDMGPYIAQTHELGTRTENAAQRIDAWLDLQIELATGPCHAAMRMLGDIGEISGELREEIGALHEPANVVLESSVAELVGGSGRDPKVLSAMIVGMVQHAGAVAMNTKDTASVAEELKQSVRRILE
jgi:AcrR family transcriptional regulator